MNGWDFTGEPYKVRRVAKQKPTETKSWEEGEDIKGHTRQTGEEIAEG